MVVCACNSINHVSSHGIKNYIIFPIQRFVTIIFFYRILFTKSGNGYPTYFCSHSLKLAISKITAAVRQHSGLSFLTWKIRPIYIFDQYLKTRSQQPQILWTKFLQSGDKGIPLKPTIALIPQLLNLEINLQQMEKNNSQHKPILHK